MEGLMPAPRAYVDPSDVSTAISETTSSISGLTAGTTQTIAGGTAITRSVSRFTTVANSGDAATLPVAKAGDRRIVMNKGANSLNVFPGVSGDKINALSTGAAYALAATKVVEFICAVDGTWDTLLTA
jgi:hypothetical protein